MGANSEVNNVVFFDGVCNLCNSSVNFLIDRDPQSRFRFASLQSKFSEGFLPQYNIEPTKVDSIAFYSKGKLYSKSRAVLEIARRMRRCWPMLYVFIIIPGFIRDAIYNWIARNRYKWFGKQDSCRMPTPELKSRFLDS
jgi:predicted DCC family thiol-disulfide oxidoreductase YuxK